MQPEKLDLTQFHRRPYRGTPKHLPHIDREGWDRENRSELEVSDPNPTRARSYPLNINLKPESILGPAGSGRVSG